MRNDVEVLVVGGGIGGLTLALQLHSAGIPVAVWEAAPRLAPLGVGINLLPHSTKELFKLNLAEQLDAVGVRTRQSQFFNRHGQFVFAEPAGIAAGYRWPQYSIHRGHLQVLLADAVRSRLGDGALVADRRVTDVEDHGDGVTVSAQDESGNEYVTTAAIVVGADGVHSGVRKLLHPHEDGLKYSGYTMWRGTTVGPKLLDGASMVRAGWLDTGKLVAYPIADHDDGTQLINWVAEIAFPAPGGREWTKAGRLDDFQGAFADWTFDWLDVPQMFAQADQILQYPMVDQDPIYTWTSGRITLLGDAAHPMQPRGSNGAGQAILDTAALVAAFRADGCTPEALCAYEADRAPKAAAVVKANRTHPPDAILREVFERTGDLPFSTIDGVISQEEMATMLNNYRQVSGSALADLER